MAVNLIIFFIVLNVVNVILQTLRSLTTIHCGRWAAAGVNALTYGIYTIVIVYTVCDLPLMLKVIIVAICNLIGVFVVKTGEEKIRKDQLWKVELTVFKQEKEALHAELKTLQIPHNCVDAVGKWAVFNVYCATQKESSLVKEIANRHHAKFFVSESKTL